MRNENNHKTKTETGRAKIPVNFIVIFFVCLLLLSACDMGVTSTSKTINPADYVCNAEQLDLVRTEYNICQDTGYIDSYCFAQAKASQCDKINVVVAR